MQTTYRPGDSCADRGTPRTDGRGRARARTAGRVALATLLALLSAAAAARAQPGVLTNELLVEYTPEWKGERFADGRPKVPDAILDRMKTVTLEEAWAVVTAAGFTHQYADGWLSIHPDQVLVGRALTSQWLPGRLDIQKVIEARGREQHRIGDTNAWPVDMLQPRDVYVSDHFGLKENGASVGDNVGSAIYAKTGNGIVYDGAVRDIRGLEELEHFTSFVRYYDPSHHLGSSRAGARLNTTLIGINVPIRIGQAFVMPGDVVLGRNGGVIFIPPQLAEQVVQSSELTRLRDEFGHARLRAGTYTAGQIDGRWTDAIEADFTGWLRENIDHLPVARAQIEEILKRR
jgi:regulator of RNase E activity RraA